MGIVVLLLVILDIPDNWEHRVHPKVTCIVRSLSGFSGKMLSGCINLSVA